MGKTTESSEGEMRAWGGNGAENISWCRGRRTLGTSEDQKEVSVLPAILGTHNQVLDTFPDSRQGGGQPATPLPHNTDSHFFQILLDLLLPSLPGPVYQDSCWQFTGALIADSPSQKSEQHGFIEQGLHNKGYAYYAYEYAQFLPVSCS